MINRNKRFVFLLLLPIVVTIAALAGAIIRLISIKTIFFSLVVLSLLFNKGLLNKVKRIIRRSSYYLINEKTTISAPKDRSEAARQSLKSIDQLTSLIQNNIASEAFKYEKELIEKELLRGDLVVVFLGTGSTGKTSIIRSLLNKIVGEIGTSMGST